MVSRLSTRTAGFFWNNLFFGSVWLTIAAALLLAPAVLWGRPFIFYDTPNYWGWGHDIWDALRHPWPRPGQAWPANRPLYGWELGAHGASPAALRFTLTLIPARSAFYAVPVYLMTQWGGLWTVVVAQAVVAAWVLKVAVRAILPASSGLTYAGIVAVLVAASSLGFETGYAMPDIFGGLCLLAAPVLIVYGARLGLAVRLGLLAVIAYAVVAHAENGLNAAAAAMIGALLYKGVGESWASALSRAAPATLVLVISVVVIAIGGMSLKAAFGQPVQMAPFIASRVLADGGGQRYLREACPRAGLAACDLAETSPTAREYYLWLYPLERPAAPQAATAAVYDHLQFRLVTNAEADQRERFVGEQSRIVWGALQADGLHEAREFLTRAAIAFVNFGVNPDFDSLNGLLQERTERRLQTVAITPGAAGCARLGGAACGRFDLSAAVPWQYATVIFSLVLLSAGWVHRPAAARGELGNFIRLILGLLLANALFCSALAGPDDRFQARVEWLIPFCALTLVAQWLARTAPPGGARRGLRGLGRGAAARQFHRVALVAGSNIACYQARGFGPGAFSGSEAHVLFPSASSLSAVAAPRRAARHT